MTKVIKARSHPPAGDLPVLVRGEAEREGRSDPEGEAERIRATAIQEAERIRAKATTEGRERGMAAVTELLVAARAVATRARLDNESDLRCLAVRIAEKLLGRELSLRPDAIVDVVRQAIHHAGNPERVVVRVASEDLAALERGRPLVLEKCRTADAVVFRADDAVARGGCVVETELGVVDAQLSTQLEAIERALKGAQR